MVSRAFCMNASPKRDQAASLGCNRAASEAALISPSLVGIADCAVERADPISKATTSGRLLRRRIVLVLGRGRPDLVLRIPGARIRCGRVRENVVVSLIVGVDVV